MAAPTVIRSPVGLRHVQVLALDTSGYPAATATSAYEGVTISGARALTITDPEPQQIVHRGDDRIFALDVLPPTEPMAGELRVGKVNDTVDAVLSPNKSIAVGETKLFGLNTTNRGNENQVCILAYSQDEDTDPTSSTYGKRTWHFRLFPRAYAITREGSNDENPYEQLYTVRPLICSKYPWGVTFSGTTEGFTQAQGLRGVAEYKPKLVAWQGDNTTDAFTFPATAPAADVGKISVWINGVADTPSTVSTTGFTCSTTPGTGAMVVCLYEVASE